MFFDAFFASEREVVARRLRFDVEVVRFLLFLTRFVGSAFESAFLFSKAFFLCRRINLSTLTTQIENWLLTVSLKLFIMN